MRAGGTWDEAHERRQQPRLAVVETGLEPVRVAERVERGDELVGERVGPAMGDEDPWTPHALARAHARPSASAR